MSKTFAIADLHGRFDLLTRAFAEIEVYNPKPHKIVLLGDYIDRGPESRQVVEYLMRCNPNVVCLKGNHEDMMVETITAPLDPGWWVGNGGAQTLVSYGGVIPPKHVEWAKNLPTIHVDKHRVFVHAGVNPGAPLDEQTDEYKMWFRYPPEADVGHGDRHVVHGHTPNPKGPELYGSRTNLDTLAWRTSRLVIAVFDDEVPGAAIDYIEVRC
jgi:serine/threonine protein phosphatase 1